ncbi:MAG: hypothetical protein ACK4ZW_07315 [Blastomonas sp.]
MANGHTEIRSALLNSETTRNNLMPGKDKWPEISHALGGIDRIGSLYDAIRKVHEASNPHETPEARAMRYEKQYLSVVAETKKIAYEAAGKLDGFAESIRARALHEAGLTSQPLTGPEIRASLRAMSQADRDKAIHEAFESGDNEVLSSIYNHNRVTWGGTSKPLDVHFNLYIDKAAPDSVSDREALDKATEGLDLAVGAFLDSAKKWRDPLTASKGFAQEKQYEQAEAALKAAMGPQE